VTQLLEELLAKREADPDQSLPVQVHAIQTHPETRVLEVCSKDLKPKAKSKHQHRRNQRLECMLGRKNTTRGEKDEEISFPAKFHDLQS
jgi:hypothetical protein